MFCHLILGLLRDGRARHGYELVSAYRVRSAQAMNAGNLYRECSKMVSQGLIAPEENPPDADPRRIPYRITELGRREFDAWLLAPSYPALDGWVLFAELLEPSDRVRLLTRLQEDLWLENKALVRAREDAMTRARRAPAASAFQPAAFVLLRRIKRLTAELEFLDELRQELGGIPGGPVAATGTTVDRGKEAGWTRATHRRS